MLSNRSSSIRSLIASSAALLILTGTVHAAARVKPRLLSFTPDKYVRMETVTTKNKDRKYYVMARDKPIEFSVTGPTTIELSTRLLFSVDMNGDQRYSVGVSQDTLRGHSQEVAAMTFTTRKSSVSSLAGGGTLVPGQGRRLKFNVPFGRHTYRIHLSGTAAHEAAVRILIPRKAIRP